MKFYYICNAHTHTEIKWTQPTDKKFNLIDFKHFRQIIFLLCYDCSAINCIYVWPIHMYKRIQTKEQPLNLCINRQILKITQIDIMRLCSDSSCNKTIYFQSIGSFCRAERQTKKSVRCVSDSMVSWGYFDASIRQQQQQQQQNDKCASMSKSNSFYDTILERCYYPDISLALFHSLSLVFAIH